MPTAYLNKGHDRPTPIWKQFTASNATDPLPFALNWGMEPRIIGEDMKRPDRPFSVVVWSDAHGYEGNEVNAHQLEDHKPYEIHTFGFILRSDEQGVTIASEWLGDGIFRDATFVPRGMVVAETLIKLTQPRKSG